MYKRQISLFSLAGLPFFAGFTTKFYLFTAVAKGGLIWLVGIAIVSSLVSLYYYLMVIKQMYMVEARDHSSVGVSGLNKMTLGLLVAGVLVIGVYPGPLVDAIQGATTIIFP